jgi:hypothetical protein
MENYKLEQMAVKEIVLSREVTGLFRRERQRAVSNLIRLKLVRGKRVAGKATRMPICSLTGGQFRAF